MEQRVTYRIRVAGELGPEWSDWFEGLVVRTEPDGTTVLSGVLADQAALHGVLGAIRDLGLVLLGLESGEGADPTDDAATVAWRSANRGWAVESGGSGGSAGARPGVDQPSTDDRRTGEG